MRAHDVSGDVGDLGSVVVAARRSVASMGLGEHFFFEIGLFHGEKEFFVLGLRPLRG